MERNDDKATDEEWHEDIENDPIFIGETSAPETFVSREQMFQHHRRSFDERMEQEKRIRREIANCNERRRMQGINAGFQSLRTLLPRDETEKLSKAAVLHFTVDYVSGLEKDKTNLQTQNSHYREILGQHMGENGISIDFQEDRALSSGAISEMMDVKMQLEREKKLKMVLENHVRRLETQLNPEVMADRVMLQYQEKKDGGAVITSVEREVPSGATEQQCETEANSLQPAVQPKSAIEIASDSSTSPPHFSGALELAANAEPRVQGFSSCVVWSQEEQLPRSRLFMASTSQESLSIISEAIHHIHSDEEEI